MFFFANYVHFCFVPDMTYNVFIGTLKLAQAICRRKRNLLTDAYDAATWRIDLKYFA